MNHWHKYPLVRIVLPFALGIFIAIYLPAADDTILYTTASTVFLLVFFSIFFHKKISFGSRHIFGVTTILALVLSGFLWQNIFNKYQKQDHFSDFYGPDNLMKGVLIHQPEDKANSYKSVLHINGVYTDSTSKKVKGKILAYLGKDSLSGELRYGDEVLFNGYLNPIEAPKNPEVFDYKSYMSLRNIYFQVYIPPGAIKRVGTEQGNVLKAFSVESRKYLSSVLSDYGLRGDDYALATALVLGYDRYLDDDLRKAYSGAGAMHVLCVSGLHVGIMYVVISFLLNLIPFKKRWFHVLKILMILGLIWLYALITGMEPAVTRASTMFSFVALGKLFRRKSRIYNTLAASALLMLIIQPNQVAFVGFQMSFLAVTGIVWLQPKIYNRWRPSNWLIDKVWGLIAVSIAAQLILFPLLIYYFHKVSLIFVVTNIIAIPLATLIIYNTLALFAFAGVAIISEVFASSLVYLIKGLNTSVTFFSNLPGAYLDSLWISLPQMFVFYLALVTMVFCLLYSERRVIISALLFLVIIFGSFIEKQHRVLRQEKFILYHVREGLAMDFIKGKENLFLGDSTVVQDNKLIKYTFRNLWEKHHLETTTLQMPRERPVRYSQIAINYPFISFKGETFTVLEKTDLPEGLVISTDYLIITGSPWIDEAIINSHFNIGEAVLFDGTNPAWYIRKIKPLFEKAGYRCHVTSQSGAFVHTF
ncbi:MAG: competence protein ComEC family protein [Bacteroidales bacterium]|nr:competence protein ComEC family protein [Bacteroidales bacterium]MCF8334614.1 competence protein ComEC family protein [Bacteroidales bacterium]